MKNERLLISKNTHKQSEFENSVESVQSGANELINLFETFQPWCKIETVDDFETLCINPIKVMDNALQANSGVNLEATGGRLPAPEMVAKLLDIERDDYIHIVKGQKVTEGCKSCNQTAKIIKKGSGVINYYTFQQYQEYLIFDQGQFSINEIELEKKKESFLIYADTPEQIDTYNFWHNACATLNEFSRRGYMGDLNSFSKLLNGRLAFNYATWKLEINEESLLSEIKSLKNK